MKINVADSFLKSYIKNIVNIKKFWKMKFWENIYYTIKRKCWSFKHYFKFSLNVFPWDSFAMIEFINLHSKNQYKYMKNYGHMVDESLNPILKDLKRVYIITSHLIDDENDSYYIKRCGFKSDIEDIKFEEIEKNGEKLYELKFIKKKDWENYDNSTPIKKGEELKQQEINELFDTMKRYKNWWD